MEYLRTLKRLFIIAQHWTPIRCIQPRHCSNLAKTSVTSRDRRTTVDKFRSQISSGPSFQDFIKEVSAGKTYPADEEYCDTESYLSEDLDMGNSRKG